MKTYKIHLIRHGRESAKGVVRYIGKTDLPLTAKGREELEQMVSEEPFPNVDAVYTSPLLRCRQTAEILFPHLEPVTEEGLTECDFGLFEDKTPEELKDDPRYVEWLSGGTPPEGESGEHFFKRSVVAFAKIVEEAMKNNASIIGLSALMTTTMQEMKAVVDYAKEKQCDAKIIIGGAVITEDYKEQIGADGYAKDAAEAVKVVQRLLNNER